MINSPNYRTAPNLAIPSMAESECERREVGELDCSTVAKGALAVVSSWTGLRVPDYGS
jgi:hypothetical protein